MGTTILIPDGTLITGTPEGGRQLAVAMVRHIVKLMQPDADKRTQGREVYASDAGMLIAVTQVVAAEFATTAAASNYRRHLNPATMDALRTRR